MRRNRLIATGAAGLLCGLAALGTLAFGAAKNPPKPPTDNAKGGVKVVLDKTSNVLNFENAVIDDSTEGTVTVSNGGTVVASFRLIGELNVPQSSGDVSALTNQLQLDVYKSGADTPLYTGSVAGFNAASGFDLGALYPSQGVQTPKSVTLRFALSLPGTEDDATDNLLQGLGPFDQRFRFEATQRTTVAASPRPGIETTDVTSGSFGGANTAPKDSAERIRSLGTGESRQSQGSVESSSSVQPASSGHTRESTPVAHAGSEKKADKPEKQDKRAPVAEKRREAERGNGSHPPDSVGVASAGGRVAGGWSLTTLLFGGLTIFAAVGLLLTLPTTWGRTR